ncbi:MAG: hypothetical protein JO218_01800 [Burkholderiales bacterium]|nr:hypothetical protein [Burkholderiales bacterium]
MRTFPSRYARQNGAAAIEYLATVCALAAWFFVPLPAGLPAGIAGQTANQALVTTIKSYYASFSFAISLPE